MGGGVYRSPPPKVKLFFQALWARKFFFFALFDKFCPKVPRMAIRPSLGDKKTWLHAVTKIWRNL